MMFVFVFSMFIHLFLLRDVTFISGVESIRSFIGKGWKSHCKSLRQMLRAGFRSVDASEFEETVGGEVLWMGFWIGVGDC